MRPFKFLQREEPINVDVVQFSDTALKFVYDFVMREYTGDVYEDESAIYWIDSRWVENTEMTRYIVKVYPKIRDNVRVLYDINMGRSYPYITNTRVDYESL